MATLPDGVSIGDKRFFLTLIRPDESRAKYFIFRCDCGNEKSIRIDCFSRKEKKNSGVTKSCGCMSERLRSVKKTKHGKSRSPEYRAWINMKARCFNKNKPEYKNYGGRGITVCDRWENSFINFLTDMGPSNGFTLDRINNDGNYEPNNCRWTTREIQALNKRGSRPILYAGRKMSIPAVSKIVGFSSNTYYRRIRRGWDDEKIFNTPSRQKRKNDHNL